MNPIFQYSNISLFQLRSEAELSSSCPIGAKPLSSTKALDSQFAVHHLLEPSKIEFGSTSLRNWSIGVMEYWSDGVMEYWSDGFIGIFRPGLISH